MSLTYQLKENINDNLKWLRNHNELCDVLLVSGFHKVSAHSCVLASHSPVLAAILQARLAVNNDWSILKPLIIKMDDEDTLSNSESSLNGEEVSILELLISFIYGEKISILQARIQELINLSKLLGLSQHFIDPLILNATKEDKNLSPRRKSRRKHIEQGTKQELPDKDKESAFPTEHAADVTDYNNLNKIIVHCDSDKLKRKCKFVNSNDLKYNTIAPFKKNCVKPDTSMSESTSVSLEMKIKEEEIVPNFRELSFTETFLETDGNSKDLNCHSSWLKKEIFVKTGLKEIDNCEENFQCSDIDLNAEPEPRREISLVGKSCSKGQLKRTTRVAISCSVCKVSFHRAHDLIRHIKEDEHFSQICPLCFLQLNDFEDQKSHFLQHDHPLPFFCFCCDLRFRSRAGLSMHVPKHSNTKPYTCEECGRGFKWRHSAQAHSITHRNHCHLLCDICGFSSKYASTFQSHLKRHYDQFFPCPHPGCNFKSFRKTHLNDHIATHAKLRPHQCEVCGFSFSQAKNLRRHMRLHTPDNCFIKCSLYSNQNCPFKTTRADKLRFHLFQKHNLENTDKISLPAVPLPSHQIPMSEETTPSTPLKNDIDDGAEKIASFKHFNIQPLEYEDKESFNLGNSADKDLSDDKLNGGNALSDNINDILMEEQRSLIQSKDKLESNTVCIPESYETFIIPSTVQDNAVIVSENISYSQSIGGDSALLLMGGIQVLNDLPLGQNVPSSKEQRKNGRPSSKIDDIINSLPVILQSGAEREYTEGNMDEFNIHQDSDISWNGSDRNNIQLIKLSDGSIGFLPNTQEDSSSSLPIQSSSINMDKEKETENFSTFASAPFNLHNLF